MTFFNHATVPHQQRKGDRNEQWHAVGNCLQARPQYDDEERVEPLGSSDNENDEFERGRAYKFKPLQHHGCCSQPEKKHAYR